MLDVMMTLIINNVALANFTLYYIYNFFHVYGHLSAINYFFFYLIVLFSNNHANQFTFSTMFAYPRASFKLTNYFIYSMHTQELVSN